LGEGLFRHPGKSALFLRFERIFANHLPEKVVAGIEHDELVPFVQQANLSLRCPF
jgi:hypothetical protein